jgi:hypothetical protein
VERTYGKAACIGPPLCNQTLASQSVCLDGKLYQCEGGRIVKATACPEVCATAGTQAVCAVANAPWPACDPNLPKQSLCDGNVPFDCEYGYRASNMATNPACASGWHCEANGLLASCLRDGAPLSEACNADDLSVRRCRGNLSILCQLGRIVDNRKCKSCTDGICQGGFGAVCQSAADCADGFLCLQNSIDAGVSPDFSLCSLPCAGVEKDNPTCLSVEVDTSLPYDSFFGKCIDGYCRP